MTTYLFPDNYAWVSQYFERQTDLAHDMTLFQTYTES